MPTIDSSVREFAITFYPPTLLYSLWFMAALVLLLAAATWLGMRFYLHVYGVTTEGRVTKSLLSTSRIKSDDFSASKNSYTRYLTIQFTGPDGKSRTVEGTHYSIEGEAQSKSFPQVGGAVPVLYSKSNPDNAMYYDRRWHYLVPGAALAFALYFAYMAASFCYQDIRAMNSLSISDWKEGQYESYQDVIIECNDTLYHDQNDAAAYERRGDAQFAIVQFSDAITDYSAALRLRPERRDLLLKRAKAEWLDGRDFDALRDWLFSR